MIYNTYSIGGELYHARSHKYIEKRKGKNGKFYYIYHKSNQHRALLNKFMNKGLEESARMEAHSAKTMRDAYNNSKMDNDYFKEWNNDMDKRVTEEEEKYRKAKGKMMVNRNEAKLNEREADIERRKAATAIGDKMDKKIRKMMSKVEESINRLSQGKYSEVTKRFRLRL